MVTHHPGCSGSGYGISMETLQLRLCRLWIWHHSQGDAAPHAAELYCFLFHCRGHFSQQNNFRMLEQKVGMSGRAGGELFTGEGRLSGIGGKRQKTNKTKQ